MHREGEIGQIRYEKVPWQDAATSANTKMLRGTGGKIGLWDDLDHIIKTLIVNNGIIRTLLYNHFHPND